MIFSLVERLFSVKFKLHSQNDGTLQRVAVQNCGMFQCYASFAVKRISVEIELREPSQNTFERSLPRLI